MATHDPITIARFWSKVDVKWSTKECWEWTGALRSGYGHIKVNGSSQSANRMAWELANEESLGDDLALHVCDNKKCCNPHHIYRGTASENQIDVHNRSGRVSSKLTPSDVRKIREELSLGARPCLLAAEFGVKPSQISKIKCGRAWRGVD